MNLLAIDTALEACAVGLAAGGAKPIIHTEVIGRGHAERLFAMIEAVTTEGGIGLDRIDRFAVTTGPGSFTGIRVGIAAVRGFALVTKTPALGFSTLAVHGETARRMAGPVPVMAMLPAKGGEVFFQMFDAEGVALTAPSVGPLADAIEAAKNAGARLAGAGAASAEADLDPIHTQSSPDVVSLLRLAETAIADGNAPRPLYIKPPDAKPAYSPISRR